jgi:uncharacterized membrane protein YedE/YeeE
MTKPAASVGSLTDPRAWLALAAGLIFALGLGISGMTNPAKVIAFLDLGAGWDPSLAFVMLGAISVHALCLRLGKRARPYLADTYDAPKSVGIDASLVFGAALFGLGWGASGFCPGPAVVSLVTLAPGTLVFVAGMLGGFVALNLLRSAREDAQTARSPAA